MTHVLVRRDGALALRVSLSRSRMSLGSNSGCDIYLADPQLAPVHGFIERRGNLHFLVESSDGRAVGTRLTTDQPATLGRFTLTLEPEAARSEARTERRPDLAVSAQPTHARIQQPECVRRVPLGELLTFGTHPSNTVQLEARFVSGNHCKLERTADGFWIEDLGSTNGTLVNGARVQRAQVQPGSIVGIGEAELVLEIEGDDRLDEEPLIGSDPAFGRAVEFAQRVAQSEHSVLILGETGTGKELFARLIHRRSRRAGRPFVAINCATLAHSMVEAELFGHEKGAFTGADRQRLGLFEEADGGTLFLDELGELPLEQQAKLLRALQEGRIRRLGGTQDIRIDVRVLAATRVDLRTAVKQGRFRDDLFYRLWTTPVEVPPLRHRGSDVLRLADHFLVELAPGGGSPRKLGPSARKKLQRHAWPGNIRELKSVLMNAHFLQPDASAPLEAEHIEFAFDERPSAERSGTGGEVIDISEMTMEEIELVVMRLRLEKSNGNKTAAAVSLGMSKTGFFDRLARLLAKYPQRS